MRVRRAVAAVAVLLAAVTLCVAAADSPHHRRRPGLEDTHHELPHAVAASSSVSDSPSRAYVTVYTREGWRVDAAEALVSVRVLLASLKPLAYPFIVLTPQSTPKADTDILQQEGATVVYTGTLGASHVSHYGYNPFVLLHAWSLTQFTRVIFLSKSSVVTHTQHLNDLFLCGEFCAVWGNPCALSTALLVLRPDIHVFADMQERLAKDFTPDAVPEYYSPEQHFLSTYFTQAKTARLFSPHKMGLTRASDEKYFRLHIYYAIPAFYYVEKRNWDLYRCGAFETLETPAATIWFGPPLPEITYPAYWYSTMIQPFSWWLDYRAKLNEPELVGVVLLRVVLCFAIVGLLLPRMLARAALSLTHNQLPHPTLLRAAEYLGPVKMAFIVSVLGFFVCWRLALAFIPNTLPPKMGWSLFVLFYHVALMTVTRFLSSVLLSNVLSQSSRTVNMYNALNSVRGSILAWCTFALLPAIDNFVYGFVNWGVHWKVITTFSVMLFVAASTFHVFYPIVMNSPIFRNALVRHSSEKSISKLAGRE